MPKQKADKYFMLSIFIPGDFNKMYYEQFKEIINVPEVANSIIKKYYSKMGLDINKINKKTQQQLGSITIRLLIANFVESSKKLIDKPKKEV